MSVRHEEPLPEIEAYRDLAPGTAVEARENDADIPVGARGTVARRIPETGNWQCVFEVEAGQRRVVSLCPDQLRPVSVAAGDLTLRGKPSSGWTEEARKAQSERIKAAYAAKRAKQLGEIAEAIAGPEPTPIRVVATVAPEPERQEPEGEGFAAAFLREAGWPGIVPVAAGPRDWRGEIASAVRRVLADAAGAASAEDLAVMVEVVAFVERREGAA